MKANVPMTATASLTQSEFSMGKPITDSPARAKPASRGFARYMLAICIGVAATLAWQSYGQVAKQIIATTAPGLGWSPKARQTIANWVEQLGWTKPLAVESKATPVTQTAPETVASKDPAASSLDPQQLQQMALDVAALRQSVEQVAASQTKMAATINNLLVTDMEIFLKIPTPPQPAAALSHKPIPAAPPRAPNRRTDVTPNQSLADGFRN
jgi:hypothetical protein